MQLPSIVCYFTIHKNILIFQNLCLWQFPITILVHFFDEVNSLLKHKSKAKELKQTEDNW